MAGKESVTKLANNEEKKKALDAAIAKLEKDFGKGAVRIRGACSCRDSSYRMSES